MSSMKSNRSDLPFPVNPIYIVLSLFIALVLNLQPWGEWVGVPDFLALVLIFWAIHQPRFVGIGVAFCLGLLMDVNNAQMLGAQALAYTVLIFGTVQINHRILWLSLPKQVPYIFILLLCSQLILLIVQLVIFHRFADWLFWIDSCVGAILWPLVVVILRISQRHRVDTDMGSSL